MIRGGPGRRHAQWDAAALSASAKGRRWRTRRPRPWTRPRRRRARRPRRRPQSSPPLRPPRPRRRLRRRTRGPCRATARRRRRTAPPWAAGRHARRLHRAHSTSPEMGATDGGVRGRVGSTEGLERRGGSGRHGIGTLPSRPPPPPACPTPRCSRSTPGTSTSIPPRGADQPAVVADRHDQPAAELLGRDLQGCREAIPRAVEDPCGDQRDRDRLRAQPQCLIGRRDRLDAVHAGHVADVRGRRRWSWSAGPLQPIRRDLCRRALPRGGKPRTGRAARARRPADRRHGAAPATPLPSVTVTSRSDSPTARETP